MKITELLKYITELHPQNTAARLALYNFLRNFQFHEDEFNEQSLNRFFCHALEYPHWQGNKAQLGKEVQTILEGYFRKNKIQNPDWSFANVILPQNCQIIELQNFQDVIEVSSAYAKAITCDTDKFKIIPDNGRKVVLVVLHQDSAVTVYSFDKKFTIRHGTLEPLRIDLKIQYDAKLELKENVIHTLEIAPYLIGQFIIQNKAVHGLLLRGYVFQKYYELNSQPLEDQPKIFVALKRLEQFFIEKASDPYYLQLVNMLEKLPREIITTERGNELNAIRKIEKADIAFSEIFIGDKTLGQLIQEARYALQQKGVFTSDYKDQAKWENKYKDRKPSASIS
jgi:hypothetical protein